MEFVMGLLSIVISVGLVGFVGAVLRMPFLKEKRKFWDLYIQDIYRNYVVGIMVGAIAIYIYFSLQ